MLRLDHTNMGGSNLGWLQSLYHFSFADYFNPKNLKFGKLRVINDDLVQPGTGFPTHPHRDMEIVTYVIDGELTHADSMGNERVLSRGDVQFMTAGTGITHSEYNRGEDILRFLQIWIMPERSMLTPNYGDHPLMRPTGKTAGSILFLPRTATRRFASARTQIFTSWNWMPAARPNSP